MRFPGFIGGGYSNRSVSADCQRTVNLYPEINEVRNAANQEIGALFSTPGESLLSTIGTGPIRGLFLAGNGNLYCVSGNGLYWVSPTWTGTLLGTLNTTQGRVQFADNGAQLQVTDGQAYVWTYASTTFQALAGMVTATVLLHTIGLALGWSLRGASVWIPRLLGGAVAAFGSALLLLQLTN